MRHSPLPRSFGLAQCSDMRISSSPICQVFLSSSLPSSHLPDPWLYNQHGPSGGTSITLRPRPALYMCASIASLSSAFYLNPRPRLKVMDVAQALSNLIRMPATDRTLALPGPSTLTYEYLLELVSTLTYNPPSRAPVVPKRVALALARAAQRIWWPLLSPDEVERRYIDDADTPGDWAFVGVEPDEIENHAITYVRRYRSAYVAIPSLWPLSAPYFFCFSLALFLLTPSCHSANYIRPIVVPPRPVGFHPLLSTLHHLPFIIHACLMLMVPRRQQLTAEQ